MKSYFSQISPHHFNIEVGDKIVFQESPGTPIRIINNQKYILKWILAYTGFSLMLFFLLADFRRVSWDFGLILALICSPYIFFTLKLILQFKNRTKWEFNLLTQMFKYETNTFIPFNDLIELNITKLQDPTTRPKRGSFHLNLIYDNEEITLLKHSNLLDIKRAGKYISEQTKVPISKKIRLA